MIKPLPYTRILLLLLFLLNGGAASCADERVIVSRSADLGLPLSLNSTLQVSDQWHSFMVSNLGTWQNTFAVKSSQINAVLRYDDSKRYFTNNHWSLTITYSLSTYNVNGSSTSTSSYSNQTLTINYDPATGVTYNDRDLRTYFNNAHSAHLTITGIDYDELTAQSGIVYQNATTLPSYLPDIYLDLESVVERYYYLDPASAPTVVSQHFSSTSELELSWNYIQGAESYDVEWLFIDVGSQNPATISLPYDFKNAVRVNVPTQHYRLTLAYPKGILLYRIRGVGIDEVNWSSNQYLTRKEAAWSHATESGLTTAVSGSNVRYNISTGMHETMNWGFSAAFAEDGKRAEALSFSDAMLKGRQAITKVNSDNAMMVGESRYDHEGRSAVGIMPSPLANTGFHYYTGVASDFDKSDFDTDGNISSPGAMGTSAPGAGNYYSPLNNISGASDYTPDAKGYPYSRVTFLNDGTSRIRTSSSVGGDLGPGSGKETKYFYGTPSQEQLDRLFGNEVGFAKHYKKNFIVDPNGQASVVYVDQEGRTIATALAGDVPANLLQIDDTESRLSELDMDDDMLSNNAPVNGNAMISHSTITVVADNTDYEFTYDLASYNACPLECYETCPTCMYNLNIHVENEMGEIVDLVPSSSTTDIIAGPLGSGTYTFTATLDVGTYSVIKTLALDPASLDAAVDQFIADQLDEPTCYEPVTPSSDMCPEDCEDACRQAFERKDSQGNTYWEDEDGNTTTSSTTGQEWIDACIETICSNVPPITSPCDMKHQAMLADMAPGGQYFDNTPKKYIANQTNDDLIANTNYYSVTSPTYSSGDINDWLDAHVHSGSDVNFNSWFNTFTASCSTSVTVNNWDDVRNNWNDCWAEVLFSKHPEYCAWEYFCDWSCSPAGGGGPYTEDDAFAYYLLMVNSTSGDYTAGSGDKDLFNPLNGTTGAGNTGTPYNDDQSGYLPTTYSGSNSHLDPWYMCSKDICDDGTTNVSSTTRLDYYLRHYLAVANESDQLNGNYFSIWYLLDNPDGINNMSNPGSGLSQSIIDLFKTLHGNTAQSIPALISTTPNSTQITPYQFFRSAYLFYRELVHQQGFYGNDATANCQQTNYGSAITGDFLATAPNGPHTSDGYLVYFPIMAGLSDFGDGCSIVSPGTLASNVQSTVDDLVDAGPEDVPGTGQVECSCHNLELFMEENDFGPTDYSDIADAFNANLGLVSTDPGYITSQMVEDWLTDYCPVSTTTLTQLQNAGMPDELICPDVEIPGEDSFEELVYGDCQDEEDLDAANSADQADTEALEAKAQEFRQQLIAQCIAGLAGRESFRVEYELKEYHYTLYYYDQAGNLVKTVPPEGVQIIDLAGDVLPSGANSVADGTDIKNYRNGVSGSTYIPAVHKMITVYQYNSLQQPTSSESPDGGLAKYWYDYLGRLVVSQDARQANTVNFNPPAYSFTIYDELARIEQVGQLQSSTTPDAWNNNTGTRYSPNYYWYDNTAGTGGAEDFIDAAAATHREVTTTYYDEYMSTIVNSYFASGQENLRNRVASITYDDDPTASSTIYAPTGNTPPTYRHASHYSYDIHGNVQELVQETPALDDHDQLLKKTTYEYDLISGNVHAVHYQDGEWDQFHHRYFYDADNRMVTAESSRDEIHWEKESKQFYYLHGAPSRTELGDKTVQGSDYIFTLQGWLKGVNRNTLGGGNANTYAQRDAGKDAVDNGTNLNKNFATDAYGFTLGYFNTGNTDYTPIHTLTNHFQATLTGSDLIAAGPDQYNGNISHAVYAMLDNSENPIEHQGSAYKYDQLYRLRNVTAWHNLDVSSNAWGSGTTNDKRYEEELHYDWNGNIVTNTRYGNVLSGSTATVMDNLTYNYIDPINHNKLGHVDNAATACGYTNELKAQAASNYEYDDIGQLKKDFGERITKIEWDAYHRVRKVEKSQAAETNACTSTEYADADLEFWYNAAGQRMCKIVKPHKLNAQGLEPQDKWIYTWYSYDAGGQVMAVYEQTFALVSGSNYTSTYKLEEHDVYGAGRLGIRHGATTDKVDLALTASIDNDGYFSSISFGSVTAPTVPSGNGAEYARTLGKKQYELSNHLGNVLVTVSDKRIPVPLTGSNPVTLSFYSPDVLSYTDYYSFGSQKPGRVGADQTYRYGFNGVEGDPEMKGEGNSYNMDFRMYDPRVGRWLSIDPIVHPWESPYVGFNNSPIAIADPSGLEGEDRTTEEFYSEGAIVHSKLPSKKGYNIGDHVYVSIEMANATVVGKYELRGVSIAEYQKSDWSFVGIDDKYVEFYQQMEEMEVSAEKGPLGYAQGVPGQRLASMDGVDRFWAAIFFGWYPGNSDVGFRQAENFADATGGDLIKTEHNMYRVYVGGTQLGFQITEELEKTGITKDMLTPADIDDLYYFDFGRTEDKSDLFYVSTVKLAGGIALPQAVPISIPMPLSPSTSAGAQVVVIEVMVAKHQVGNWVESRPMGVLEFAHRRKKQSTGKSRLQDHQEGLARNKRDQGGEKGDSKRRPLRKRPPNHKGPWPPKPKSSTETGE